MTKITIFKKDGIIYAYKVKGHSEFADFGKDIVCSAISTASQMVLGGLKEVCKVQVDDKIEDGFLQVGLNVDDAKKVDVQTLLKTLELTFDALQNDYAKNVRMEVKEDVY